VGLARATGFAAPHAAAKPAMLAASRSRLRSMILGTPER
jgi:hypothetical protein